MRDMENPPVYNPEKDGEQKLYEGDYPAHISSLECKTYNDSTVYDYKFKIATEAHSMTIDDPETKETVPLSNMVGKEFNLGRDASVWLNPNPGDNDGWKNRKYIEFHTDVCGLKFPTKTIEDVEVVTLQEVEIQDVFGIPVIITLAYEFRKDDKTKKYMKVVKVTPWDAGKRISKEDAEENDLPF